MCIRDSYTTKYDEYKTEMVITCMYDGVEYSEVAIKLHTDEVKRITGLRFKSRHTWVSAEAKDASFTTKAAVKNDLIEVLYSQIEDQIKRDKEAEEKQAKEDRETTIQQYEFEDVDGSFHKGNCTVRLELRDGLKINHNEKTERKKLYYKVIIDGQHVFNIDKSKIDYYGLDIIKDFINDAKAFQLGFEYNRTLKKWFRRVE